MTKADYKLICAALLSQRPEKNWLNKRQQWEMDVAAMCDALLGRNDPKFDQGKFLRRSGMND